MCQDETIPTDPSAAEAGDAADASVGRSLDMLQMKFSIFCHLTANSKQDWHANVPVFRPCSAQYVPMYDAIVL